MKLAQLPHGCNTLRTSVISNDSLECRQPCYLVDITQVIKSALRRIPIMSPRQLSWVMRRVMALLGYGFDIDGVIEMIPNGY